MKPAISRPRRRAVLARCLAIALLCSPAACGKKGPPLAPVVRIPAAPDAVALRRQGDEVVFQFRVPAANADGSTPASLRRVDVYAYTGEPRDEAAVLRDGTLVASIPVRQPRDPDEEAGGEARPAPAPGSPETGFSQGETVRVVEPIGPEQRELVVPSRREDRRPPAAAEAAYSPSLGTSVEISAPLRPPYADPASSRSYYAVGVSAKGRRGRFTPPSTASLLPAPSAPQPPSITYGEEAIRLAWAAPPDLAGPTLAPAGAGLLEAKPFGMPSASGGFYVYRVEPGPGLPASGQDGRVLLGSAPAPVNTAPLEEPRFEEPTPSPPEGERCYAVTSVNRRGGSLVESQPSAPACVTMADVFPPAPPTNLAAVGSAGGVSLIWEASPDADVAGYLVLRSGPGGELAQLTGALVSDTTYRDERVTPGVVHSYAVVAVDKAGNRSEPSNRVEESAR